MIESFFSLSFLWAIPSYFLGSLPIGLILSRLKGQDPRTVGSGNIGATNVMRTSGKIIGSATLVGDALKGFLPVWLALRFGLADDIIAMIGFAAFLGHLYPIYLKFKGGKGIATSLGIFLALSYIATLFDIVFFVAILWIWRYVSLGSLVCAVMMPLLLFLLHAPYSFIVLSMAIAVFTLLRHRDNITRLLSGKENRLEGR
jgi:acyl phosphate:glycerol-3-phosphate acyltransferase